MNMLFCSNTSNLISIEIKMARNTLRGMCQGAPYYVRYNIMSFQKR